MESNRLKDIIRELIKVIRQNGGSRIHHIRYINQRLEEAEDGELVFRNDGSECVPTCGACAVIKVADQAERELEDDATREDSSSHYCCPVCGGSYRDVPIIPDGSPRGC